MTLLLGIILLVVAVVGVLALVTVGLGTRRCETCGREIIHVDHEGWKHTGAYRGNDADHTARPRPAAASQ